MSELKIIELDDAVSRIKQACEWAKKKHVADSGARISPFFFMVGAGMSVPSVPLASEIVKQCIAEAGKHSRQVKSFKDPLQSYSHSFEVAFPDPTLRQNYLRELIEGQPISHANFRLAHLLLNNTVSNMVVTTNFDDFLSRALMLFGRPHIVCDHPQTAGRIDHTRDDIQIVHLHGTYWFYDCCNLQGEVEDRASEETAITTTMTSLLNHILWTRSPLIIGYSGWERDVFMQALSRRLHGRLGTNAYWFCYKKSDIDGIPERIRTHPNIYFVVPTESKPKAPTSVADAALSSSGQLGASAVSEPDEAKQPADTVLGRLVRAFELGEPGLTSDPLGFFMRQLQDSLPGDDASDTDIFYSIKSVIERVRRAQDRETQEKGLTTEVMECIRSAMRRADYRQVINCVPERDLDRFLLADLQELADASFKAVLELEGVGEEELKAYDLVIRVCNRLSKVRGGSSVDDRLKIARVLFRKGFRLGESERREEAIAAYGELDQLYRDATEINIREHVARAVRNKGFLLWKLTRYDEAMAQYDEVEGRYGNATELSLREQVVTAMVNKGFTLGELNRTEEAIAVYDKVMQQYGDAAELALREQTAMALRNKGVVLGKASRGEEAIAMYNEVDRRYGTASELVLRAQVAGSLRNKGVELSRLKRVEEAIAVYDEVDRRFADANELVVREQVAASLLNKGIALGELNRSEEEIAVYSEVERRFGAATELKLREQVAKALLNKGITLAQFNRHEEAVAVFDEMDRRYRDASETELREQLAKAMRNRKIAVQKLTSESPSA